MRTDYYRIIESSFEEFERGYPDQVEEKYGYLRTEVMKAIYSFLECGIPENGIARVRCEECGHVLKQVQDDITFSLPTLAAVAWSAPVVLLKGLSSLERR